MKKTRFTLCTFKFVKIQFITIECRFNNKIKKIKGQIKRKDGRNEQKGVIRRETTRHKNWKPLCRSYWEDPFKPHPKICTHNNKTRRHGHVTLSSLLRVKIRSTRVLPNYPQDMHFKYILVVQSSKWLNFNEKDFNRNN